MTKKMFNKKGEEISELMKWLLFIVILVTLVLIIWMTQKGLSIKSIFPFF